MQSLSLYQLTQEQQAIESALIDNGGELTPELEKMLEGNSEAIANKVDGYNMILRRLGGSESVLDTEIKRLTALKKTAQNAQRSLKDHLLHTMQEAGLDRLDGNLCKAYVRHTQSVDVDECSLLEQHRERIEAFADSLPDYCTVEVKVVKAVIKDGFKQSGVLPPGCIIKDNESLIIM